MDKIGKNGGQLRDKEREGERVLDSEKEVE